jgi:hypothetical protein
VPEQICPLNSAALDLGGAIDRLQAVNPGLQSMQLGSENFHVPVDGLLGDAQRLGDGVVVTIPERRRVGVA